MVSYETYAGCIDTPDGRDIPAEIFLSNIASIPSSFKLARTPILNQGNVGACTVFGVTASLFETAALDAERNGIPFNTLYDVWDMWNFAKMRGASDKTGWTLQAAIQLIKDKKYSVGYAKVISAGLATVDLLKNTLLNGYALYTGAAYGDWSKIGVTHYFSEKAEFAGHAFCIVGYDDSISSFIVKNSWGPVWGDTGYFYIRYADIASLYSIYIQLDASDADALADYRNNLSRLNAEIAKNGGIWNGDNPTGIATDHEITLMCSRALKLGIPGNREFWAITFNDLIVRSKAVLNIWNSRDGKTIATEKEIATMFTRAVKREPTSTSGILTRLQVAAVVGRDLM